MKNILKKILITAAVLIIAVIAFFKLSPYPGVWIVRYNFNKDAAETNDKLESIVPPDIHAIKDIRYDTEDDDAYLDVYFPSDRTYEKNRLPLIVWTHGGGLISGSKDQLGNYCKILASKEYSVVSIDYTVAPEAKYPTPVKQLNKALSFISLNPDLLKADTSLIILAGDSGVSDYWKQRIGAILARVQQEPRNYCEVVED